MGRNAERADTQPQAGNVSPQAGSSQQLGGSAGSAHAWSQEGNVSPQAGSISTPSQEIVQSLSPGQAV